MYRTINPAHEILHMQNRIGSMNLEKTKFYGEFVWKTLLSFFMTKIMIFDRGLSQGVSKIGPTHQITLSTDLGGYRETPTEIRWINPRTEGHYSLGYQLKKLMT